MKYDNFWHKKACEAIVECFDIKLSQAKKYMKDIEDQIRNKKG